MDIATAGNRIPAMDAQALQAVYVLQEAVLQCDQHQLETHHAIHGGMYARTIRMKAGEVMTGALINVPTMLILNGDAKLLIGDKVCLFTGYNVISASAGRKQAFVAMTDLDMTMIFATSATTVIDAENEFTTEADQLMSRHDGSINHITITGE